MTTDPKKSRTQLEQEVFEKHQQGEAKEFLDVITQENEEKAADAIIEVETEAEKNALEDKMEKVEALEIARKFTRAEYIRKLAEMIIPMFKYVDIPAGWTYRVNHGNTKLNIVITTKEGKSFGRGIIPCGEAEYDFHAIGILLTQCENTIDMILERGAYRNDGLILPK